MKIKSKILSSFLLTAMFTCIFALASNVNIFAAVEVYLDGTQLTYREAQPQIINDWTMVPLTETAEHFEMTPTWDSKTRTMVFTSPGRTMIHTINDNKIYVNGEVAPFEENCRSTIVNDRTLMPIRMLAESIGAKVEWEFYGSDLIIDIWTSTDDNATVESYQGSNGNDSNIPQTPAPAADQTPTDLIEIYAVAQNRTTIEPGESVRISADTNKAATMVKVTDFEGNLLREVTDFEEDDQGRYFNVRITPEETGEVSLKIYAGNEDGYSLASKNLTVQINAVVKNIFIESIKLSSNTVAPGKDVDIIFYTSKNVTRVTIADDKGVFRRLSKCINTTTNYNVWETFVYAESKVGEYTYTITAYDINGASEEATFIVPVKEGSNDTPTSGFIQKMEYEKAGSGEKCKVTITTSNKVETLKMLDYNDELIISESEPDSESGSTRVWKFSFRPDYSDGYDIYVYDANGKELENTTMQIDVY